MRQRRVHDLLQQVADAPADRIRVEVGAEDDPVRAEAVGEVLDEVEVVTEARVEDDVRRDLGDVKALPRGFETVNK